jgi:hypothetical protein
MYLGSPTLPHASDLGELHLEQSRLDIIARSRTSRLPWRGQFSPELIEYLLETVCPKGSVVFDPFCGSGTVLFEVAQRGGVGLGAEINPAAWHLASLISFCGLKPEQQASVKIEVRALREGMERKADLFSRQLTPADVLASVGSSDTKSTLRMCLSAAVLLGMGDKPDWTADAAARGLFAVESLLGELAAYPGTGFCHLSDARSMPLEAGSVEAVITSPPYINVFNYHQNYRPAAELLGWQPLEAAQSEIGANRKHRMNRFLTVVQYCLDMAQALDEVSRVCRIGAPVVLVIGRESNVLGAAFKNGELLKQLMEHSGAFDIRHCAERVFTNRFGARIYEDIIVANCVGHAQIAPAFARSIGRKALDDAVASVPEKNRSTLEAARAAAMEIKPSRLLAINPPAALT